MGGQFLTLGLGITGNAEGQREGITDGDLHFGFGSGQEQGRTFILLHADGDINVGMRLYATEGVRGQARVGALMLGSGIRDGQRVDTAIIQCGHIGTFDNSAIAEPLDLDGCG